MNEHSERPLRIGIVAGEASGDILGGGLIAAIKQFYPNAQFEGIGGPLMMEEGCNSHYEMEELSVMGLVEVLGRLRKLLRIRKELGDYFIANPPDVFIGIDAPDFTLRLERRLKQHGIKTVHYVSPSVWAWRKKRIFNIKKSVDLMLCLLPFEQQIYIEHQIESEFVGHTLADEIPMHCDKMAARAELEIDTQGPVLALLPGSRGGEVSLLSEPFLLAAAELKKRIPDLAIVAPMVNPKRKHQFLAIIEQLCPDLPIEIFEGESREVMMAADVVMLASGTATLEAALIKRPMIIGYKFKWLSYQIINRMVKLDYYSLPNLLAGKPIVPELIQDEFTCERLVSQALEYFNSDNQELMEEFSKIHQTLSLDASRHGAKAVLKLIGREVNDVS